jgi:hypothetical protein
MMIKRAFEGVVWLNVVIFFLMYNFFNISKAIIKSKFYIFFWISLKKSKLYLYPKHTLKFFFKKEKIEVKREINSASTLKLVFNLTYISIRHVK